MWTQRATTTLTHASGVAGHVALLDLLPAQRGDLVGSSRQGQAKFLVESVGTVPSYLVESVTATEGPSLDPGKRYRVGGESGFAWPSGVPFLWIPVGGSVKVTPYTVGAP